MSEAVGDLDSAVSTKDKAQDVVVWLENGDRQWQLVKSRYWPGSVV